MHALLLAAALVYLAAAFGQPEDASPSSREAGAAA
jgi:hypothetical protein